MIGLLDIQEVFIKQTHIEEAYDFLQEAGNEGYEAMALFAGSLINETSFEVKKVIIPIQTSYILEEGLMYAIDRNELHRLNTWLYENKLRLIAQIHSHPTEAYHSEADDRFPVVDIYGGISIVVPDFAEGKIDLGAWAIYRLSMNKTWDRLSHKQVHNLFQIID